MGKRIPIKIDDTIAYTVLEIRFDLAIDSRTLLSKIVPVFSNDLPKFESINQEIPLPIRDQLPRYQFVADYRFMNDDFVLGIGKNVVQFEFLREYESWEKFGVFVKTNLKRIFDLNIVEKINRIGLRYSNILKEKSFKNVLEQVFEFDFQRETNLSLNNIQNTYEFTSDDIKVNLTIASNAEVNRHLVNIKTSGLLVDIDVSHDHNLTYDFDITWDLINRLHEQEKIIFFNALKQEFIDSRNPIYE